MGLSDLPDDCIALTLSFLESPRDVLVFEATCKRFWAIGRASEVWAARLKRHFDLRVQVWSLDVTPEINRTETRHGKAICHCQQKPLKLLQDFSSSRLIPRQGAPALAILFICC